MAQGGGEWGSQPGVMALAYLSVCWSLWLCLHQGVPVRVLDGNGQAHRRGFAPPLGCKHSVFAQNCWVPSLLPPGLL